MDFSFQLVAEKLEEAARKAFQEMYEKHHDKGIYGFALYSDEGAMSVYPSTNTMKHLARSENKNDPYFKFEPTEWKYVMKGASPEFKELNDIIRGRVFEIDEKEGADYNEQEFYDFQKDLYETCVRVLEKLKNEGFFKSIVGRDIFLMVSVIDYEFDLPEIKNIISRLNDNEYTAECLAWMKTW